MKMKEDLHAILGKPGMKVRLKKTSIKEGKTSGVRVGKVKTIELFVSIKTECPITALREIDTTDPRKQNKKVDVTSKVKGIYVLHGRNFKIETDTSFYEAEFLTWKL